MNIDRNSLIFRLSAIAAILAIASALAAAGCCETKQTTSLTILYTNDVHGHQFPFDYDGLGRSEVGVGGAARRIALIRSLKASSQNPVLVMDAGDIFTRGPLARFKGEPEIAIMNAAPYDVMTLGNEDILGFAGLGTLLERLKQAEIRRRFGECGGEVYP